jgi:hypothetical protein
MVRYCLPLVLGPLFAVTDGPEDPFGRVFFHLGQLIGLVLCIGLPLVLCIGLPLWLIITATKKPGRRRYDDEDEDWDDEDRPRRRRRRYDDDEDDRPRRRYDRDDLR